LAIKVLEEIEHIQKRAGMYIGDTTTPMHLVTEVLDNALDELANGYATKIEINITKNTCEVSDNGRGIPLAPVKFKGETHDPIIVLVTKLFSGGKFDLNLYNILIGMHGVGLTVCNALSDDFHVICRDKKAGKNKFRIYRFKKGKFVDREDVDKPEWDFTTKIYLKPNKKFFDKCEFDITPFKERLRLVKASIPEATLVLNNEEIQQVTKEEYIREVLSISEDIPLFFAEASKDKFSNIKVWFTYDLSDKATMAQVVKGDVNLRNCGGTYLSTISTVICNAVSEVIPKAYIMSKSDAMIRFRGYVSVTVPEPKFDSQTKEKFVLNIKPIAEQLLPIFKKLFRSESYLKEALETINNYRILKKAKSANGSNKRKKRISAESPLRDSLDIPGDRIYIVEGASAGGTLTQCRNPRKEAVFPLKGKVINVLSSTLDKVLANKEIKNILECLNINLEKKTTDYRYKEIVLVSDPDPDGGHINCLILLALSKFCPDLIRAGRVKILIPPLYGKVEGKKFVPIYDERIDDNSSGQLVRFKGLGEFTPNQMRQIIQSGKYYTVKPSDDIDKIYDIFLSPVKKRTLLDIDLDECNWKEVLS